MVESIGRRLKSSKMHQTMQTKEGDKEMTRAKAIKKISNARENLKFWQDAYIDACRSTNPMMDTKSSYLAVKEGYKTIREAKKAEAVANMNEAKEVIARMERIAR